MSRVVEAPGTVWEQQRERAAIFWLRLLAWIGRRLGRPAARLILYPITLYYLLTAGAPRRASRQFLQRALGRPATLADVARHIHAFASVVLDRLFAILGRTGPLEVKRYRSQETYRALYPERGGCLLFTAHLGSFEVLRAEAAAQGPIKVLLDREHAAKITRVLTTVNPALASSIIDTSPRGPGTALAVQQALDENLRVGIMVDRARAGEETVRVPFFGQPAAFPLGPWRLAAALQARIVLVFGLYRGGKRYDAHFELFSEGLKIPRAQRAAELQLCVQRYAQRLEHYARQAPYNWFNFYNFWNEASQH